MYTDSRRHYQFLLSCNLTNCPEFKKNMVPYAHGRVPNIEFLEDSIGRSSSRCVLTCVCPIIAEFNGVDRNPWGEELGGKDILMVLPSNHMDIHTKLIGPLPKLWNRHLQHLLPVLFRCYSRSPQIQAEYEPIETTNSLICPKLLPSEKLQTTIAVSDCGFLYRQIQSATICSQ